MTDKGWGFVIVGLFFWWAVSPDSFYFVLVVGVIVTAAYWAFIYIDTQEKKNAREADKVERLRLNKLEEDKREELRVIQYKYNEKFKSEMATFNLLENDRVNHDMFLSMILSQYKAALNSDRAKIMRADKYGRITEKQKMQWKSKLLEVCATCSLNQKDAKFRSQWARLVSIKYDITKESYDNLKKYLTSARSLESTIRKYIELKDIENADLFKTDLLSAFERANANPGKFKASSSKELSSLDRGIEYELECAEILRACNWTVEETPLSGDHGADLLAYKNDFSVAIQCKNFKNKVGNTPVQEIIGAKAFYSVDHCVVVARSGYTKGAEVLAEVNRVSLISELDLKNLELFLS